MTSAHHIERPRVAIVLDSCPISVVVAPAGYGKSTAAESWLSAYRAVTAVIRPLASRHGDGTAREPDLAFSIARQISIAARRAGSEIPDGAPLVGDGTRLGHDFVHAVADAVTESRLPLAVVLDDLHRLPLEIVEDLGLLCALAADERHRFAALSRRPLPWPVQRWVREGFASTLGAADLAYTPAELREILGRDADLESVQESTRGWPAAVEAIRWRESRRPETPTEGVMVDVVDFINDEILADLARSDFEVLVRCSILGSLRPSVAGRVTREPAIEQRLLDIAETTSLIRVDTDGFELHPLFGEALRRQIDDVEDGGASHLHLAAAAAWSEEPDGLIPRMEHLLTAKAWGEALYVLRESWQTLLEQSRFDLLTRWLESIPRDQWERDATTVLLGAGANFVTGRTGIGHSYLALPSVADDISARAVGQVLVAHATWWATEPYEALDLVHEARSRLESIGPEAAIPTGPGYESVGRHLLLAEFSEARSLCLIGRFDEAGAAFDALLRRSDCLSPISTVSAHGTRAWISAMTGDVERAVAESEAAFSVAQTHGIDGHERTAPAVIALSVLDRLSGDFAAALHRLDQAASMARTTKAWGLLHVCDLVAAWCDEPDRDFLDGLNPAGRPQWSELGSQFIVPAKARRRVRSGTAPGSAVESEPHEYMVCAQLEVMTAVHGTESAHAWLQTLPPPRYLPGRVVRCVARAAVASRKTESIDLLNEGLDLAGTNALDGLFHDAPLTVWRTLDQDDKLDERLRRLKKSVAVRLYDPSPGLSRRELDVLRLLDGPLQTSDLAAQLFVSPHTIRTHITRIYRKLRVTNRADAVTEARRQRIIS